MEACASSTRAWCSSATSSLSADHIRPLLWRALPRTIARPGAELPIASVGTCFERPERVGPSLLLGDRMPGAGRTAKVSSARVGLARAEGPGKDHDGLPAGHPQARPKPG